MLFSDFGCRDYFGWVDRTPNTPPSSPPPRREAPNPVHIWQKLVRKAKNFRNLDREMASSALIGMGHANVFLMTPEMIRQRVKQAVVAGLVSEKRAIREWRQDGAVLLARYIKEKFRQSPALEPDAETEEAFAAIQEQRLEQYRTEVDKANGDTADPRLRRWGEQLGWESSIAVQCRLGDRERAWTDVLEHGDGLVVRLQRGGDPVCYHDASVTRSGKTVFFRRCALQFT